MMFWPLHVLPAHSADMHVGRTPIHIKGKKINLKIFIYFVNDETG